MVSRPVCLQQATAQSSLVYQPQVVEMKSKRAQLAQRTVHSLAKSPDGFEQMCQSMGLFDTALCYKQPVIRIPVVSLIGLEPFASLHYCGVARAIAIQ
jgi:hypothetical protein